MTTFNMQTQVEQKIQYGKYMIDNNQIKRGVEWLTKIHHPDTDTIILQLAQQSNLRRYTRQVIAKALIDIRSPEAIDCFITNYANIYPSSPMLLRYIHTIDDARVIQPLINQLERQLQKPPKSLTRLLIEALGKLKAIEAIPLLEQIIKNFPFESTTVFISKQPLALIALNALREINNNDAQAIVHHWQCIWDAHMAYHLQHDTIFNDENTRLILSPYLYKDDKIRDYLIDKLEIETEKKQLKIVMVIFLRMIPVVDNQPALLSALIDLAESTDDERLHMMLIARLSRYPHERLIPIAFDYIAQENYTESCIRIFIRNKVYSDTVMKTITDIIYDQGLQTPIFKEYLNYLKNHHTPTTEAIIIEFINIIDNQKLYRSLYNVIGKFAHDSDTAFNVLCEIIQNGDKQHRTAAISALRYTRERGLWLLISIIKTKSDDGKTALKAISTPAFADAVPHLIQELLNSEHYPSRGILTALKSIGTEQAYATINAWYINYGYLA